MPSRRVAIIGGAFDPIHFAHLLIAEEARVVFDLDEVVFIPNNLPPIPKHDILSPADRAQMVELAIASNPHFTASRIEIDRDGPSYSYETVLALKAQRPQIEQVYFLTGADAILGLQHWRNYEELLVECEFIAATRPGFDLNALQTTMPPELARRVLFLPIPGLEISSTSIRERIKAGRSIRYLTPDAVVGYIQNNGLYR
jgi:nicotinate-nucleotide adenylyltransferase